MDGKYRYLLINQEGSLLDHYTKNKKKRTHTKSEPGQTLTEYVKTESHPIAVS